MINNFNKAAISMVVNQAIVKNSNAWFYQNYGNKLIEASCTSKVLSIHSGNNVNFRRVGKTQMLVEILKEVDKSIVIVGNHNSKTYMQSRCREKGIKSSRVILITNNNDVKNIDLTPIRGFGNDYAFLFDDSVCEDTVTKIKGKCPDNYTFGFAFKKVVSLI